jgi:hypothetical protein
MHRAEIALAVGLFLVTFVGSVWAIVYVIVRMPEDYLNMPEGVPFWPERPAWQRVTGKISKNILGLLFVAIGIVLSVPGIPGQGALTILIGVILLDLPGKRRFERRVLGSPKVLAYVNRLRARYQRPPLRVH